MQISTNTVGGALDMLALTQRRLAKALSDRHPHDSGSAAALSRPLRLKLFLALDDLNQGEPVLAHTPAPRYTVLRANTAEEARAALDAGVTTITAAMAARVQRGWPRRKDTDRPLRMTVFCNLADLDRTGPLDVEECLWLPYDGIPPGLLQRPNRTSGWRPRQQPARRQKRSLLRRLLGI